MHQRSREGRFVLDGSYRIVEWDDAAAELVGVPSEDALGRPCREVLSGAMPDAAPCLTHCPLRRRRKRGWIIGTATRHGADGASLRCRLTTLPGGGGGAVGSLRFGDTGSEAAPASDEGLDTLHALAAFASLATELTTGSLTQRLDTALERIRVVLGADATEAFLLEPGSGDVVLAGHAGGFRRAFEQRLRFAPHEGVPGRVAASTVPLVLDRLSDDARYLRGQVVAAGFRAYACVPLPGAAGPIGTLAAAFRRPPADLRRPARFLGWSAPVVASAIQAALTEQMTAHWTATEHGFEGARRDLFGADQDDSLEDALTRLVEAVGADGADLVVGSERTRDVPVQAVAAVGAPLPGSCTALQGRVGVGCCALNSGTPQLLTGDSNGWPDGCRHATQRGGVRTCLPLELGDGRSALLRVWRARRGRAPLTRGLIVAELNARAIERLIRSHASGQAAGPNGQNGAVQQRPGAATSPGSSPAGTEVRCFGPFELRLEGALVAATAFRRSKSATLLKVLLLQGDRAADREELLEALWPGADPDLKASQLHVLAHELRRVLASVPPLPGEHEPPLALETVGRSYRLHVAQAAEVDLHAFERSRALAHAALQRGRTELARQEAERATVLYRGALFEDDPYAEWCWQERERLREACQELHALAARLAGDQADWSAATGHWRSALRLDPLREEVRRGLMRSLWHEGKRDQALEQFRRCETLLQRELGVAPLPATLALVERIRRQAHP